MRFRSLSDLAQALETAKSTAEMAHTASPAPSVSTNSTLPGLPEAHNHLTQDGFRATRLAVMVAWYEVPHKVTEREPDATREYLGPRFAPPKARLPKRTGQGNLG